MQQRVQKRSTSSYDRWVAWREADDVPVSLPAGVCEGFPGFVLKILSDTSHTSHTPSKAKARFRADWFTCRHGLNKCFLVDVAFGCTC